MRRYRYFPPSSITVPIPFRITAHCQKIAPLPKCLGANQLTCRILPSRILVPLTIRAPGPWLPQTALAIRLDPTPMTPMPQRSTGAALVPTLRLLFSVGSPRSRTKGHGTAWSSPGDQANRQADKIESKPLG